MELILKVTEFVCLTAQIPQEICDRTSVHVSCCKPLTYDGIGSEVQKSISSPLVSL